MKSRAATFIAFLIALGLLLLSAPLWASGDCRDGSCNELDISTGDTSVLNDTGGNRSVALGNVLGDVDIADCLGSTQWNTPLYGRQRLVLNNVCMAEFYLRTGKYELAAMALCNVKEILDEFADEASCEAAHDFTPPPPPPPPEPTGYVPEEVFYQQEQIHDEQIDQLVARIEVIEQRPEPRPRPAAPRPQVVQQPLLDNEQRSALEALLTDEDEE